MEVLSVFLIAIYCILALLTFFFLCNFRDYLKNKPPGCQTLLDGANIHLIEYLSAAVFVFHTMAVLFTLSNNAVNKVLADLLAWLLLTDQQIFYYQFLICGVVRLSIVLHWNSPINDEKGE